ncbi:MAG: hypothetical protein JSS24_12090 [Proteobacteria bacterium]|nr:hypothetical protein [Pseudomonadota bacterium]
MADSFDKLVVRAHSPRKRAWLIGGLSVAAIAFLYGMFELGRYDAGYRVMDAVRGAFSSSSRMRELTAENARLRQQLEAADVARRVDREGYAQVEKSLGDMQSQIARLNQDLSFYRGLVQPETGVGVKVQRMQIVPEAKPGQFRLKFILMQVGRPDRPVNGNTVISIDGISGGKPFNLSFARVSPKKRVSLAYSFRYFQDFDELVQLPAGFEATRIDVEIHSGRDVSRSFRQAFVWKTQGVSMETEAKDKVNVPTEAD